MALDPKEGVLALHRFGFGPRAGSIEAIASDPRGALLAELERPNAGLIVDCGSAEQRCGQSRGIRVQRRARRTRKARAAAARGRRPGRDAERGRGSRNGSEARGAACRLGSARGGAAAAATLSQRGQGAVRCRDQRRDRLGRAAGVVLVEPFLRQRRRHGHGRRLRARSDPPPCAGPVHRHAARGRKPSGDAALSRQRAVDRPRLGRRHQSRPRASTRTSRAKSSNCTRSACAPSTPRPTSPISPRS